MRALGKLEGHHSAFGDETLAEQIRDAAQGLKNLIAVASVDRVTARMFASHGDLDELQRLIDEARSHTGDWGSAS